MFLIVAARCPVCGEPVCLDGSTYPNNYECPLRLPRSFLPDIREPLTCLHAESFGSRCPLIGSSKGDVDRSADPLPTHHDGLANPLCTGGESTSRPTMDRGDQRRQGVRVDLFPRESFPVSRQLIRRRVLHRSHGRVSSPTGLASLHESVGRDGALHRACLQRVTGRCLPVPKERLLGRQAYR